MDVYIYHTHGISAPYEQFRTTFEHDLTHEIGWRRRNTMNLNYQYVSELALAIRHV